MAGRRKASDTVPEPVVEAEQVEEASASESETATDGTAPEPVVEAAPDAPTVTEPDAEYVLVQFAYANAKDGEVVQLVKGAKITDRFKPESIEHLRSIGFVGPKN